MLLYRDIADSHLTPANHSFEFILNKCVFAHEYSSHRYNRISICFFYAAVLDHSVLVNLVNLLSPIQGVLIGESPVYMKTSYSQPPNVQPKNGDTIGI